MNKRKSFLRYFKKWGNQWVNIIIISGNSTIVATANICELPGDSGPCVAAFPRYYFNKSSGMCEKFIYGGCEGNQNNFRTIGECKRTCEGTFLYFLRL